MTSPVLELMLVNLSLRLVIAMTKPEVQPDYSKCMASESDTLGTLFPSLFLIPCLECVCFTENGEEKCHARKVQCPPLDCKVYEPTYSGCCRKCKGCFYNGASYENGAKWSDKTSPCRTFICREGIVSLFMSQCYAGSNSTTLIRDDSSTSCCTMSSNVSTSAGQNSTSVDTMEKPLPGDPCTLCRSINGLQVCRKEMCPILPCATLAPKNPSKCCRECDKPNFSPIFIPEKWCLVNGTLVENGKWLRVDKCRLCQCLNGTAVCTIESCPQLRCNRENIVYSGNLCCPRCQDKSICMFMGTKYKNGDVWFLKGCVECNCKDGRNYCRRQLCRNESKYCPAGQTLGFKVGSCCKICIKKEHHCATFGDPHYQTFDGKFYSFQGICKYKFIHHSTNLFKVQVKNSARYTGRFSWTKAVIFKVGKYTIALQQKLKLRVNGKRTRAPFLDYPLLDIRGDKRYLKVYTNIGVTITWDGDSYLSVSLSDIYRNQISGLCGNFNGNPKDDLSLPNGRIVSPKAFAAEWLVSKDPSCHQLYKAAYLPRNRCKGFKLRYAHKTCRIFRDRKLRMCHVKVNPALFHQSCVSDVCECPFNGRCECSAIKAYMAECRRRIKGRIRWKYEELCDARCEGGSRFSYCGPACRPTCKTLRKRTPCYKPCVQGCHCNAGFVWHRNRCILPRDCPRK